jgi:hypothetical protein
MFTEYKRIKVLSDTSPSSSSSENHNDNLVTPEFVKKAAEEYNQDPLKILVRSLCQLDKAILVGACKHIKASGENLLYLDLLWERLQDFLQMAETARNVENPSGHASEIDLLLPPYEVFEMAVERMIRRGLFKRVNTVRFIFVPRLLSITLKPDLSIIAAGLKDSEFFKFM